MKKYKSINRAMQRGHLTAKIDTVSGGILIMRKSNSGRELIYTRFNV